MVPPVVTAERRHQMAAVMELPAAPLSVGRSMAAVHVVRPARSWRWSTLLLEIPLLGAAAILNATIVGAVLGVPLFLVGVSLLTLPQN
jgi:hypothetical protein